MKTAPDRCAGRRRDRAAFTLVELSVVLIIVGVMASMAIPLYTKALEQARVDAAATKLQGVWSAQRIYWLDRRTFASSLGELEALDLVDASYAATQSDPDASFVYEVLNAGDGAFVAQARRNDSNVWSGAIQIDQSGQLTGDIRHSNGTSLTPPE